MAARKLTRKDLAEAAEKYKNWGRWGPGDEAVQKLNDAMNRVLQMREVRERLEGLTFEPIGGTPQQFTDYVRSEVAKWTVVVKQTGAKLE